MITECKGDLLTAKVEAIVNPVNCVGVMGAGLALQVRMAFPEMFSSYQVDCWTGRLAPGRVHIWETRQTPLKYVLNVPTKRHWKDTSLMTDISSGLVALLTAVHNLGLRSAAVPALGCGLGGLKWAEVRPMMVSAFELLPVVDFRLYVPGSR